MVCPTVPPGFPPPPPPPPPPPWPPPPPGGDSCYRYVTSCVCIAGVSTWVVGTPTCVPNADCTSSYNCLGTDFSVEVIDGCSAGVPLFAWTPDTMIPPCAPSCCSSYGQCKTVWRVTCTSGVWTIPTQVGSSICTAPCAPYGWTATDGLGCVLEQATCNGSCTPGESCPDPGAAPAGPVAIPPCCATVPGTAKSCQFVFTATCLGGSWLPVASIGGPLCVADCTADTDWVAGADSCHLSRTMCGGACSTTGDCGALASPKAPAGIPACCLAVNYCNCVYTSTYDCGTGLWSTPAPLGGSLGTACTTDAADHASAWAFTSGCDAQTTVSIAGVCG